MAKLIIMALGKIKLSHTVVELPDGKYQGLWGGYDMEILGAPNTTTVKTIEGCRGENCETELLIENGIVYETYETWR